MTSIFQVFVDKENAGPLGKHPKGKISSTHEQSKLFSQVNNLIKTLLVVGLGSGCRTRFPEL